MADDDPELNALLENAWVAAAWMPLDGLEAWVDNPRDNDGEPAEEVAASIERFGFVAPICAWTSRKRLVAGHTRMKAMRLLWAKHGPEWTPKGAPPQPGLVPVRMHEFANEDEANAYAIADNRLNELAKWKMEGLRRHIVSWHERGVSMKGIGFDAKALKKMIAKHKRGKPTPARPPAEPKLDTVVDLRQGDCIEVCKEIPDETIDAIVTDPPYGIGFMGSEWDGAVPGKEWAEEMFRVAKPGAHLVAFAATRTLHRMAVALEEAGWEIRDTFHWLYYNGFPKSNDVSLAIDRIHGHEREDREVGSYAGNKVLAPTNAVTNPGQPVSEDAAKWFGWGTSLKPSIEPAILVRKPLTEDSIARQVLATGTGALNIRACRHAEGDPAWPGPQGKSGWETNRPNPPRPWQGPAELGGVFMSDGTRWPANVYHCPKPSPAERERGCEHLDGQSLSDTEAPMGAGPGSWEQTATGTKAKNIHPTVKPVRLMRHLVRLMLPYGGTLLEPFAGSGTTLVAGCLEGAGTVIGVELTPKYIPIIEARVDHCRRYPDEWEYTAPGMEGDGSPPSSSDNASEDKGTCPDPS